MLLWSITAAMAQEPVLDGPVEPYPSVLPDRSDPTGRWSRADHQGAKATRAGAYLCVGSATATMTALGLMALQDEAGPYVAGTGGLLYVAAVPALVGGPPVLLGGSLRSRRALKERGVRVSALPGAFGWTLYALTPFMLAVPNDQSAFGIASYGGAIALGFWQSHLNDGGRRGAGLHQPQPTPVARPPQIQVGIAPQGDREQQGVAPVGNF